MLIKVYTEVCLYFKVLAQEYSYGASTSKLKLNLIVVFNCLRTCYIHLVKREKHRDVMIN